MSVHMDKTETYLPTFAPVGIHGPRVDLMPPEIGAERAFRKTQFAMGGALVGVIGLLACGWAFSVWQTSNAADALAVEQNTARQLAAEEAKYAEVPVLLTKISNVQDAQTQAMASDIAWASQLDQVSREFPQGLIFDKLTMALNDTGQTSTASAVPLASGNTIGTIQVEGVGPNYINGAQWLDAMGAHPGFVDPYLSSFVLAYDDAAASTEVVQKTSVGFTDELLTHRFDQKAGQ